MNNGKNIKFLTDTELVATYRQTDDMEFAGELFRRYSLFAFGVSMKFLKDKDEAKDAAMQIFEKLLTDLKKSEVANFKGWLYTVVRNHCLMHLRDKQSQLKHETEWKMDASHFMELNQFSHLNIDKEETMKQLEEGITQLNEKQRKCIELFYLQEKCYKEVSEITGYGMVEVKSYIQNGKRNLKNYLIDNMGKKPEYS